MYVYNVARAVRGRCRKRPRPLRPQTRTRYIYLETTKDDLPRTAALSRSRYDSFAQSRPFLSDHGRTRYGSCQRICAHKAAPGRRSHVTMHRRCSANTRHRLAHPHRTYPACNPLLGATLLHATHPPTHRTRTRRETATTRRRGVALAGGGAAARPTVVP